VKPEDREVRPQDSDYYEDPRSQLLSQGDVYNAVPLAYPVLGASVVDEGGSRRFISGPLEPGPAMLITPTCQMTAQGTTGGYAHSVRTLVPILSVDELLEAGVLKQSALDQARRYDDLHNYMYLPALAGAIPESMALLYMPVTVGHSLLEAAAYRRYQLRLEGARQLQRKLTLMSTSLVIPRAYFEPPMD
jgi:hypothetical protein